MGARLEAGVLDAIGSDHVAAVRERKSGSIWDAQLGFAGIATILPVLLSEGVNRRGMPLARVVGSAPSTNPARIFGLALEGRAAARARTPTSSSSTSSLEREVNAEMLGSVSDFSIYEGRRLRGWPVLTVCRGAVVMRDGECVGQEGHGRFLRRRAATATDRHASRTRAQGG